MYKYNAPQYIYIYAHICVEIHVDIHIYICANIHCSERFPISTFRNCLECLVRNIYSPPQCCERLVRNISRRQIGCEPHVRNAALLCPWLWRCNATFRTPCTQPIKLIETVRTCRSQHCGGEHLRRLRRSRPSTVPNC